MTPIGWRLDRALAAAVPTLSRERFKALIGSGAVIGPQGAAGPRSGGQGGRRRPTGRRAGAEARA